MDSVFDELYKKYHQDVFQFLFYMVKNKELAEDLVQEVYIRVLKSYERFEGKSSEKTWLFSIARNVAIDSFRKQKGWKQKIMEKFDWSTQQVKDEHPLPDEIAVQREEIQMIYRCLDLCTIDQRLVIIMRYIHELTITETADSLGWTESKVKTTQHRALKVLKNHMEHFKAKEGMDNEGIKMER
ncbi:MULTISPECIES: RNA polymerase sigma factor SigX [Bacillales]|jgi:RNA polymerase sigma-70 factor (ECF subfamily)|uniref:RNA polymerase sigma factor n=1 Tax=Cytobacillus firmus TaxID=1399 RepID=A0AA46PBH5_CYTFI|nr:MULTISPECIES: RNA polymerase sigma factor SigX [Bacillales]KML46175.1 RNA polymerase sigma factor SigX [Cytobacillus firmus]MCC3647830.1 RNA polymerase sigma factor SigX [Cytobacillus oceanisediminis]MCS0654072.1 RNA polymerase sigma factor SigX [Cytobacillus firmus]MCU1805736.1 RNA polymerase sigma factor SigX [Cytobacillus firmus]OMF56344.1 RNA polymerase sigma factor SigX [Paenibacillus sp. FSL R5-0490]